MRKILGLFLSLCLTLGMYLEPVLALNHFQVANLALVSVADKITIKDASNEISTSDFVATGNLELDVKFVLPISNVTKPNIKITLGDSSGNNFVIDLNNRTFDQKIDYVLGSQSGELAIRKMDYEGKVMNGVDGEEIKYYSITVYNLRKGKYSVSLSGDGYKDYTVDNIVLDDYAKRVSISNEKGMFEVGDVNNDNVVDEKDIDLLIEHIDSVAANDLGNYDLNRDGEINIADVAMVATVINGKSSKATVEDTIAIIDKDSFTIDPESTTISGDVANLFQPDGSVKVENATGEEITPETPAVIALDMKQPVEMEEIRIEVGTDNVPEALTVIVTDENGKEHEYNPNAVSGKGVADKFTDASSAGTIVVDLQGQIAVKKVTIKITKSSGKNLAEIAEVEFLNNVKEDVLPPNFGIVNNVKATVGSEKVTITYNRLSNITGYEILLKTLTDSGETDKEETLQTTYETYEIEDLKNYEKYQVLVRGVNGEWKGGYSSPVDFSPIPTRKPPKPDMVKVSETFSGLDLSWKDMDDTLTYNIYYRIAGTTTLEEIREVNGTSYQLRNLEPSTKYEIYISGNNHLGEGERSILAVGTTLAEGSVITPKYHLINRTLNNSTKTDHIEDVVFKTGTTSNDDKFAMVDDDYHTYWTHDDWQINAHNYNLNAPVIVLDKSYKMNRFIITVPDSYTQKYKSGTYDPNSSSYNDIKVHYWNNVETRTANNRTEVHGTLTQMKDVNGRLYYLLKLEEPITADAVQFGLTVANNGKPIQIAEVKLYEYDEIEGEIEKLFTDELHLVLADGVTKETITNLQAKLDVVEKESNERHPDYEALKLELDYALQILNDVNLHDDLVTVKQTITTSKHTGFSGLSALQPLGVSAKAGDTIIVYVGTKGNVLPEIIFTQFYSEAGSWSRSLGYLKKGANVIQVPKVNSYDESISGGSLYVKYPNSNPSTYDIKVRVSGGTKIPTLDLYDGLEDETTSKAVISSYLSELETYVNELKKKDQFNENLDFLNATEIGTRNGLFSVSATKIYNSIITDLKGNTKGQVDRIYNSLVAFEEMVKLFYNHKGLSTEPKESIDRAPMSRINIRAMRMFDGAFMYASGDHIGIEHGSVPGLMQGMPNQGTGANMTTTGYFGWGISHEIGHQINQGNLAHAEVTNNVFALLAQTSDDHASARIEDRYDKIYKKVTSNTLGKGTDVFVTLAMYWQLHLAYDDEYTFSDTNSIFARINKESRRVSQDAELKDLSKDELLIILASKAAGKDLTEHFLHWGIAPTDAVKNYLAKLNLEKETRPIWYLNDGARRYRLSDGKAMTDKALIADFKETDAQNKRYTIEFTSMSDPNTILGYEIKRNGKVIMFTEDTSFTDLIGSLNNQALVYEVTAYDKYLNPSNTVVLDEVKVSHDGSIIKDNFGISSNFKADDEIVDDENPDMNTDKLSVNNLIDGKDETIFNGTTRVKVKDTTTPYILIDLNDAMDVSGLKYRASHTDDVLADGTITKFVISVSKDGSDWKKVKEGTFDFNHDNEYTDTVYFDKPGTTGGNQLWTYSEISYVKIEAVGNKTISGAEIDVIAPPGDNVDMSSKTIGKLSEDYHYLDGSGEDAVIPAGSVIFKGDYRGNPSFNVVLLVDAKDDTKAYDGENFLFAKLDDTGNVSEIASGYWFYAVTKEQYEEMRQSSDGLRAELYRVDDALSNNGQRLTSTSMSVKDLPTYDALPDMQIVDTTKGEN